MGWFYDEKPRFDIESSLRLLARKLDNIEARISYLTLLERQNMSTFADLKAAQDATNVKIAAVKSDVERLIAALANIPAPGLTAEQQEALDAAVAAANGINDSLSGVDAMTPEPVVETPVVEEPAVEVPADEPVADEPVAEEPAIDPEA
jgi:hypothetical protein